MSKKNVTKPIKQGFTLIELMVVLVIIGVLLTFTTLSMNRHDARHELQTTAQRLTYLLQLAHEQAMLQGVEMGLEVLPTGYRFYQQQPNGWQLLQQDDTFYPRELPPATQWQLDLENRAILLEDVKELPQVLLLSSGELIPFRLRLELTESSQALWQIEGTLMGHIQLTQVTDATF